MSDSYCEIVRTARDIVMMPDTTGPLYDAASAFLKNEFEDWTKAPGAGIDRTIDEAGEDDGDE